MRDEIQTDGEGDAESDVKDDGVKSQKSQEQKNVNIDTFSESNNSVSLKTSLPFDKDSIVNQRKKLVYFSFLKD